LPRTQVDAIVDQCWKVDTLADVGELARATLPRTASNARSARLTH
jgi:hypothetical protein